AAIRAVVRDVADGRALRTFARLQRNESLAVSVAVERGLRLLLPARSSPQRDRCGDRRAVSARQSGIARRLVAARSGDREQRASRVPKTLTHIAAVVRPRTVLTV